MTSTRLKELRKAAGMSQELLARKSDISISLIRAFEQKVHQIEGARYITLLKISNALGIPFWELFEDPELAKTAVCNTCCRACTLRDMRKQ